MDQANNVSQYLKILERYDDYTEIYYRGQSAQYKSITASITRDQGYLDNEYSIYAETIQMKADDFNTLITPISRLSKLQHYGVPTRLIDVSIDPLVALFFAVEDIESEFDALVYVYIQKGKTMDSKHIRLLALLAILNEYDTKKIQKEYQKQYEDIITENDAIEMAQETAFVRYTEDLKETNSRLYNQKGTFAICGNVVLENAIQRKIKPLDSIKPIIVIRIPYEHKITIKRELDEKYGINRTYIYPEFPSVSDYIKEKYKYENFTVDGTYVIMEKQDVSHANARRLSLVIVLQKLLRIDQIKQIAIDVMEKYKKNNDVVWLYIAKNGDDLIMRNWIIRGQWISPALDPRFNPRPINDPDENGYCWVYEKSYSSRSDYNAKHVFDYDKNLYVYNHKIYEILRPLHDILLKTFKYKAFEDFKIELNRYREKINQAYMMFGEFGYSRNKDFNDFLYNYERFAISLDNIHFWVNNQDLNEQAVKYRITRCFQDAQYYLDIIINDNKTWKNKLGITQADYEKIDPFNRQKKQYQFEQTIPLNPQALTVDFDVQIIINSDNTFTIVGQTNIFNKAVLMLSVREETGKLHGQSKSEVVNGKFDFGLFSNNGAGYKPGNYKANISLSIPNVQPKEFTQRAGIEYENLTGPYVDRTGIGPTLNYEITFIME